MRHTLTSLIAYAPPDDLGAAGAIADPPPNDLGGGGEVVTPEPEPPVIDDKPRVESVGDSIRRAVKETRQKAQQAAVKPAKDKTEGAPDGGDTVTKDSTTKPDGNTTTTPQGPTGAPQAWKAEEKAIWDSIPEAAKAAINRREADTAKGVQELRTRYQEIDAAIAPYSAVMKQNSVTPAQAITKMFQWNMEMAGPNKVAAFKQLAQSFGIDPATLATAPTPGAQPGAAGAIPDSIKPVISDLEARLRGFETSVAAQQSMAAQQTWVNWSKDKPHVEDLRALMANLVNSDLALLQAGQPQVSNTIKNGTIDMDAAYEAAKYAHPDVRKLVLQEEQKKRDAEAKAAAEKARKAGGSLRSGAPAAGYVNGKDNSSRVESPRESIQRALAELRGA